MSILFGFGNFHFVLNRKNIKKSFTATKYLLRKLLYSNQQTNIFARLYNSDKRKKCQSKARKNKNKMTLNSNQTNKEKKSKM